MMIYLAFARTKDVSFFFFDVFPNTSFVTLGGFAMGFEVLSLFFGICYMRTHDGGKMGNSFEKRPERALEHRGWRVEIGEGIITV